MQRIILTTGGTGGHIFPALAAAEELKARFSGIELLFVGSNHGPEKDLSARAGIPFAGLPVRGFLGRGTRALAAAAGMLRGIARAFALLRSFRPDAVIGFGGYAAFAVVFAARFSGIPTAVHEQNALAGISNRILGRMADRIFCSLPSTRGFGDRPTILTGNPVRRSVVEAACRKQRGEGRRLLVMGGSQGAHAVNAAVSAVLPRLKTAGIELRHQTGEADSATVRDAYAAAGINGKVEAFIHDMGAAYAWADLALCRAGATTVAELAACGLPAVFIPFPHATHDHQSKNAALVAERGAALMIAETDLAKIDLGEILIDLLTHPEKIQQASRAMKELARPDAAAAVADELEKLVGK